MGSVYLARHPRLPRQTALKVLNSELFADTEMRARFEREADLAAQLEHPNIVTVYDRGVDGDRLWISMQFVDGVDAATIARPVPVEHALHIIEGTAAALDHAHEAGVLHRDVKPANILLTGESGRERVLLTDFGIARPREDTSNLTRTGTFNATLAYAAPEQLTGSALDHRADQYSLACTLFALLTGAAPFAAANPVLVIQGHLQSPPPSARGHRRELPAALDAVLARALAKRPADRFDSCAEFTAAARRAVAGVGAQPTLFGASSMPRPAQANPPAVRAPSLVRPQPAPASEHGATSRQHSMPQQGAAPHQGSTTRQGHLPQPGTAPRQGSTPPQGHPPQRGNAPQQGSAPQGHAPRPVAPGRPPSQRPVAPARRGRRGPLVALAIVVALLAGAGVWVWRDDTGFIAVALGRSPGHGDLNAMAAAFPGLLPGSDKDTDGYFDTTCRAAPQWQSFYAEKGVEAAFNGWRARWECLSPSGDGFAFRFYSFDVGTAAESAVATFAVDADARGESADMFRRDHRFVYRDEYGGVVSTVISRFTDTERERFVLFTIPRVMGEQVLDELSQQVATAPW
ncbi:hypothetical protein BOX37_21485 [Nocardia mangyaensis]|uniref:non-specific serine/threonine protein kinase n=2 Tax=Nocardia mangyaensis TaxID=2213200 RepID=A0A1J0VVP8_9NOCA|nr:hypothetical protein BOX37_21485 [Nocardia mangyaensis]